MGGRGISRQEMRAVLDGLPQIEAAIRNQFTAGGIARDDFDSWIHSGLGSMALNARDVAKLTDSIRRMTLGEEPMDREAINRLGSQVLTVLALFFIVRAEVRRSMLN